MTTLPPAVRAAAERILAYLGETDAAPTRPVDAIIGFGVFDLTLPRYCAELHRQGLAPRVIFTGGIGGGSGSLGGPEADVWRAETRQTHPTIPDSAFILESRSTNTSENVRYTAELLTQHYPELAFGRGIRSALLVASPSRLRRVRLTMRHQQPDVAVIRRLPRVDFEAERALYEGEGVPYLRHLLGELDRILAYPQRGWIAPEPLPEEILMAREVVRAAAH